MRWTRDSLDSFADDPKTVIAGKKIERILSLLDDDPPEEALATLCDCVARIIYTINPNDQSEQIRQTHVFRQAVLAFLLGFLLRGAKPK